MIQTISNAEVIKLFKQVDDIKAEKNIPEKIKKYQIEKLHNKIIKELSFLVHNTAKYYKKFPNHEDLSQEGFIGLIKAVRRFDYTRFPNFFIYAEQWIRHRVKYAASKFDILYNPNRIRVVYIGDMEEPMDEDLDVTPEDIFSETEKKKCINNALNDFSDRDREIVKRIFGLDDCMPQTLREIGPDFNITYERVRQIKDNVISKLKKNQQINELR